MIENIIQFDESGPVQTGYFQYPRKKLRNESPILNDDNMFIRVSYSVFVILCQIDETKSWIDATDP